MLHTHQEVHRFSLTRTPLGVAVVALHGQHDVFTALVLRDRLEALLERGAAVVVDLTRAHAVDDAVVAMLLAADDAAREQGGCLALVLDPRTAQHVLGDICPVKLARRLLVAPTRAQAIDALAPVALAA